MTTHRPPVPDGRTRLPRLLRPGRLLAVDLARGLALLGMMATHVISSTGPDGDVSWAYRVASGRASALFAVLAGISLVLSTRARPTRPDGHGDNGNGRDDALVPGARRGVLARAGVITVIGLTLGTLDSGVAVILVNYGVLFAVGALLLTLTRRTLLLTAVGWLLLSPVAAHLLRAHVLPTDLAYGPGPVTSWQTLADPAELATTLLLTGYYPVLQWTGYLLVGLTVARFPLRQWRTGALLAIVGGVLALAAKVVSGWLVAAAGGTAALPVPAQSVLSGTDLDLALRTGAYGTTPTTSWWWLAVAGPHTGTPPDLVHTTGTALLVLGVCVLLVAALPTAGRVPLLPLAAAGSMTLTLYSVHVVALAAVPGTAGTTWWVAHVVAALVAATAWQATGRRGPLEDLASAAARAARDTRH